MTNIYKASFRFYEAAAPFPGTCLRCGTDKKLWELGMIRATNLGAYYCDPCLVELGDYAGLMAKTVHQSEVEALEASINTLRAQVEATPSLAKELIHDLNNLFSNFVTDLASHASAPISVQQEASDTNTGESTDESGEPEGTGPAEKPAAKSSSKSSRK